MRESPPTRRKPQDRPYQLITVLTEEDRDTLAELCHRHQVTRAELVRRLIRDTARRGRIPRASHTTAS